MRSRGPLLLHGTASLVVVLFTIITDLRLVNARTTALRVAASPHWQGLTGNWATFQVSVGSPHQAVELTVSTTSSGLRVLERANGGDKGTTFNASPGFALENSTSWIGIDPPRDLAYKGLDTVQILVTNSAAPPLINVGIDVTNRTMQVSPELGWIGLGILNYAYKNTSVVSLISQLHNGEPDIIPSPSYGYTAGASYANGKGVTGSLTLGGYDSVRFPTGPETPFKLYNDTIPAAKVVGIELLQTESSVNYIFSDAAYTFLTVMDPSTPYLWLPRRVCDMFAKHFNLTWNEDLQLYLFASTSAAKEFTDDHSSLFRFNFVDQGGDGNSQSTISISPFAFALMMIVPNPSGFQLLPYFPLKRGPAENGEYTIGRAFFQEAYLLTDYDKATFYMGQDVFPDNPNTNFSIVDVVPLPEESPGTGLTGPQKVGIGVGVGVGVLTIAIWILLLWVCQRRRAFAREYEDSFNTPVGIHECQDNGAPKPPAVSQYRGSEDLARNNYYGGFEFPYGEFGFPLGGPDEHPQIHVAPAGGVSDVVVLPGSDSGTVRPPSYTRTSIAELEAGNVAELEAGSPVSLSSPAISSATGETNGQIQVDDRRDSREAETSEADSISTESISASDSSLVAPTLEIYKQRAVDSLMTEFKSLLSHGPNVGLSIRAGGGGSNRSSVETGAGSKHGRDESAAGDNSKEGDRAEAIKKARLDSSQGPRFACPYYRRNPKKHLRHRACAGPGWTEVRRVKEHLYRTHALPIHCHRCGSVMNSDAELKAHQRQPEGCEVRLVDLPEGFGKKQEEELRKKKHGETEEDRWYALYKILFPDEDGDLVPSPYYQSSNISDAERQRMDELKQYERFQRRELLRAVRRLLEEAVSGMAGPLEDQLRTHFVGIIRQAQTEVFQAYRGSGDSGKGKITARANGDRDDIDLDTAAINLEPRANAHERSQSAITPYLPPTSSTGLNITKQYPTSFDHSLETAMTDYGSLFLDQATLHDVLDMGSTPFIPSDFEHYCQPDVGAQAPAVHSSDSGLGQSLTDHNTRNVDYFQSVSDHVSTLNNNRGAELGVISGWHPADEITVDAPRGAEETVDEFVASQGGWDGIFS